LFEKVENVQKEEKAFIITSNKNTYSSKQVVVATGFYDLPNLLNVPGENLEKVAHYYNNPHYYSGQKVAVIGASNSAIDAALECWRKGADVTLIIRGVEVGQRVKYWVRPDIINRIEEGSIKAFFNTTVKEIKKDSILLSVNKEDVVLANDFVLALTGYKPNFKFIEMLGVHTSNDEKKLPEYNPETMETNVKGLYLAGVICGGMETHKWFIENSRIHAKMIINHITTSTNINPS
jgi:thioredoxin reductase (NADPH)